MLDETSTVSGINNFTRASKPSANGTVKNNTWGKITFSNCLYRFLFVSHMVTFSPFLNDNKIINDHYMGVNLMVFVALGICTCLFFTECVIKKYKMKKNTIAWTYGIHYVHVRYIWSHTYMSIICIFCTKLCIIKIAFRVAGQTFRFIL